MNAINTIQPRNDAEQYLFNRAPSIFAGNPQPTLSDKYAFVPTIELLRPLFDEGFTVSKVSESRVRVPGNAAFARHQLRLRIPGQGQVGDAVPEIVVINSHNGSSALDIRAGLYRLVCSNGLTVGNDLFSSHQRHVGIDADGVIEGVFSVVRELPLLLDTVNQWKGIHLDGIQQDAFAKDAALLRWDADENGSLPIAAGNLLRSQRWDDQGTDLWRVYNRVQERLIKGGVRAVGSTGRIARSRAVGSVGEDARINKGLWNLAEHYATAH